LTYLNALIVKVHEPKLHLKHIKSIKVYL